MASAPPMETAELMGHLAPQPPSYEETLWSANAQYSKGYPGAPPPMYPTNVGPPNPPAVWAPNPSQAISPAYPPPPHGAPASTPVAPAIIVVQPGVQFGDYPVQMVCPVCSQMVSTQLIHNSGAVTWLACAGLAVFGCIYGCCLIPFCMNSLKNVTHVCPNCRHGLGVYKRC